MNCQTTSEMSAVVGSDGELKPYVVVPVPVRDRIYARMTTAETKVKRLEEELGVCTAKLRDALEVIQGVRSLIGHVQAPMRTK